MRLWSLHPTHLDRIGLVAWWREALLAQAVLAGRTRGYRHHPQLERFKAQPDPLAAIGHYLDAITDEAVSRGYRFDRSKILKPDSPATAPESLQLTVTSGQLTFEHHHLARKLEARSPNDAARLERAPLRAHPSFVTIPGEIESWERAHPQ